MVKRAIDVLISAAGLLVFLPFGVLLVVGCRLSGDGKVFYRQRRLGFRLRPFDMLKFASMRDGSPTTGTGSLTVRDDPRVYAFGRFLRMTKLNEVPQLWNVVRGDMSLVGPRPMLESELDHLPLQTFERVYAVPPGVTGLGSLIFRDEEEILSASGRNPHDTYRELVAPLKADIEVWYAEHRTLWMDLSIMVLTAWLIARRRSLAYKTLFGADWPEYEARIAVMYEAVGLRWPHTVAMARPNEGPT